MEEEKEKRRGKMSDDGLTYKGERSGKKMEGKVGKNEKRMKEELGEKMKDGWMDKWKSRRRKKIE